MVTHIIELSDCISLLSREQVRRELELAGVTIMDEKINFFHKSIKFYVNLKESDENTQESFLGKLKLSPIWPKCARLIKIVRGTKTFETNLIVKA